VKHPLKVSHSESDPTYQHCTLQRLTTITLLFSLKQNKLVQKILDENFLGRHQKAITDVSQTDSSRVGSRGRS